MAGVRHRAAGGAAIRKPLEIPELSALEAEVLDTLYRTARVVRLRTRAQFVLLAGEQRPAAPAVQLGLVREPATMGASYSQDRTIHAVPGLRVGAARGLRQVSSGRSPASEQTGGTRLT
jgi:hypothetical protein